MNSLKDKILVNGVHQQGIGNLANGFLSTATSVDNLVEAIEIKDLDFGIAVQWHPEQLFENRQQCQQIIYRFY